MEGCLRKEKVDIILVWEGKVGGRLILEGTRGGGGGGRD